MRNDERNTPRSTDAVKSRNTQTTAKARAMPTTLCTAPPDMFGFLETMPTVPLNRGALLGKQYELLGFYGL